MSDSKKCTRCGVVKPLTEFSPEKGGRRASHCKACKAAAEAERKAQMTPEEKADAQAAYRAGIREGRCAVCGTSIEGRGICVTCQECVDVLGGLEGLKRAVSAVRYLTTRAKG